MFPGGQNHSYSTQFQKPTMGPQNSEKKASTLLNLINTNKIYLRDIFAEPYFIFLFSFSFFFVTFFFVSFFLSFFFCLGGAIFYMKRVELQVIFMGKIFGGQYHYLNIWDP